MRVWNRPEDGRRGPPAGRAMMALTAAFAALACVAHHGGEGAVSHRGIHESGGHGGAAGAGYLLGPAWGALAGSSRPGHGGRAAGGPRHTPPATLGDQGRHGGAGRQCATRASEEAGAHWASRPAAWWESCPWCWAYWFYDGLLMGSLAGAAGGDPQQPGAGGVRDRGLRSAGGGSGPQRLHPAGVPTAVRRRAGPEERKNGPPAGSKTRRGAVRLRRRAQNPPQPLSGPSGIVGAASRPTPEVRLAMSK